MSRPLAIDLFCGLGGWTEGFLAEGWDVIGFDIERHVYGSHQYPAQLVLQDIRTLHGSQFKDAACIVASSPCQKYSYMAMPWTKAKALAKWYREPEHPKRLVELNELFVQARRIQVEAIEAAGHFIPMVQENVRGAIPWVGRSRWNFGSYHLWGDVPALMPFTNKRGKVSGGWFTRAGEGSPLCPARATMKSLGLDDGQKANPDGTAHLPGSWFAIADSKNRGAHSDGVKAGDRCLDRATGKWTTGWNVQNVCDMKAEEGIKNGGRLFPNDAADAATKNEGGSWFAIGSPGQKVVNQNPVTGRVNRPDHTQVIDPERGTKGYAARLGDSQISRRHGSKSSARKAASARIAKIPFALASHIARIYHPRASASIPTPPESRNE